MRDLADLNLSGTVVDGRFEIVKAIGQGAMGAVYQATQLELERSVALKILADEWDEESRARFARESEILSALSHPNIARFFTYGEWQERYPYFAMELLPGESLKAFIQRKGKLSWTDTLALGLQICSGLKCAHAAEIIHRDLTPRNVIVDGTGKNLCAKIIDFGLSSIASAHEQNLTKTGFLIGTPHYMSPEICVGKKLDKRSDIYSLGCILYECLTGVVPFDADSVFGIAFRHVNEPPIPPSEFCQLPSAVEDLVLHALAKNPESRFANADEFLLAMNHALSSPSEASRISPRRPSKLNLQTVVPALAALSAVCLVLVGGNVFRAPIVDMDEEVLNLTPAQFEQVVSEKVREHEWRTDPNGIVLRYEARHRRDPDPQWDRRFGHIWLLLATHASQQEREKYADKALPYLKAWEAKIIAGGSDESQLWNNRGDQALAHLQRFIANHDLRTIDDGSFFVRTSIAHEKFEDSRDVHLQLVNRLTDAGRLPEAIAELLEFMKYKEYSDPENAAVTFVHLQDHLKLQNPGVRKLQASFLDYASAPAFRAELASNPKQAVFVSTALDRIADDAKKVGNAKIAARAAFLKKSMIK